MTKAILLKGSQGWRGSTPDDQEAYAKFLRRLELAPQGKWMRLEWSAPRHGKHHRKFMALLTLVAENSEVYDTKEKALVAVKLAAGFFDPIADPTTGEVTKIPHSISYEKMDQDVFDKFYSASIDAVLRYILPQIDRPTADRLMEMIIEGWG